MPHEFRQAFSELRQAFIAGLPERAHKLDQVWTHLHRLNWNEQGIRALQRFFHKLSGSSATYGYTSISGNAQYLAGYLQELLDLKRQPGNNEREHINQRIEALRQQMVQASELPSLTEAIGAPPLANQALYNQQLVYVIEPDRGHASLVCRYLRRAGLQTQFFENVGDCMTHPHENSPQAILLDADLHPEGVVAVIRSLKSLFSEPVPVLLMSARSDAHTRLRALRAGCDDYLIKPLNFNLLLEKLLQTLHQPNRIYRVMIVEDDQDMAELEAEILRYAGMEVLCINRPLQSLEKANTFKPDLAILDMHMPEMNGIELARLLRQDPEFLLLPIIFVTADTDVQLHRQIQALGVNALLVKPLAAEQLIKLCEQALVSTNSLKNRVARITQRSYQAHQITPGYFFAAVEEEIHNVNLGQDQSALYYLSPNHYQELVDRLDRIELSALHEAFCEHLGEILGTDEHWVELSPLVACVMTCRRSLQYHHQRGEQLAKHLSQHPYRIQANPLLLDFGVGLVPLNIKLGSAHQALLAAEEAFEQQTGHPPQGDNHIPTPPHPLVNTNAGFTGDSLDINKDLVLTFQPIISLEDAQIEHFSVLTRLRRSDGELIPASQFLRRLDEPGKRLELDRWVLQKAVSTIAENSSTREHATLFMHLDKETLAKKNFFSFAANVLRSSRLRGSGRLVFMLEEPWVLEHPALAQRIAQSLLDIECGICLTHAGNSEHSIRIINQLPLHYVRLSPHLTAQGYNPQELKAILAAARDNGVKVIATQIEDSHNLSSLWMQGIRLFEGFFIQPPDSVFHLQNDIVFAREFIQQPGFDPASQG
ncbi:EAL domain-containing protein [Cellvibrio japonicus]|uniref:Putative two-component, response regulator n=1 Tax=Cellvibrio japonicus (strain Ueda107) TaxID=498211 RepID=B3PC62_CELJU|nr:EAL domain-containing protein [Cellvibrio japonicus]ACE83650.1 putative two-component, response regulator [Cellvibrio japonicus Ueda107]QEI13204.1 EAL domain-containing protein [Cellvibrio japonicus]QEI16778.1 EAL domain-containing protein [Cellvibrio japonicus]QEI20356.1 EAL domain-containing protein [Cellvibrio japonicus]